MLNVTLAPPQRHETLSVYPLVTADAAELPYQLLVDALEAGTLEISELGAGTVSELLAINRGDAAVLVLDGEQLAGARQNRLTSRSLLLPAGSATHLPVSCMEQGRWSFISEKFLPTKQHSPGGVRRRTRQSETDYAALGMRAPPEVLAQAQHAVWKSIALYSRKLGCRLPTGALDALYDIRADDIESWTSHYPAVEGQVGLLAFRGDCPLGLDLIGGRGLYARLHDRLVRGYVMDALDTPGGRAPSPRRAAAYLDHVRAAPRVEAPTVGLGSYAVLLGTVIGGELRHDDRVVHLSAFPGGGRRRLPDS